MPPTLCFSMSSEAWAFVNVQVGVSLASITARTVVSPGSKPAVAPWAKPAPLPVPMVMTAPLAVQAMFVSVQPGSGVSCDVLGPELGGGERERRVGRGVGGRGVAGEGGRQAGAGAAEVEGRGAAHALLLDVERGPAAREREIAQRVSQLGGRPDDVVVVERAGLVGQWTTDADEAGNGDGTRRSGSHGDDPGVSCS